MCRKETTTLQRTCKVYQKKMYQSAKPVPGTLAHKRLLLPDFRVQGNRCQKRIRRRPQADAAAGFEISNAFGRRSVQQAQQNRKDGRSCIKQGKRGRNERSKIEDCLQLHLGMLMLSLERVGMHDNHAIHHMRVGKQRNSSQIDDKQQGKKPSGNIS